MTFVPGRNRPAPSATVVRIEKKKVVVALDSRKEMVLDLRRPDSVDVASPRQIEVSLGDKILIRANDKRLGLTNGQLLTISSIVPDGAVQTKEGFVRAGRFSAMVSWLRRYVPQGPRMDGRSCRRCCESAHLQRSLRACSRGRHSCIVHTPDKARLMERLPEGNRRAALDVLSEIRPKNASIVNRVRAWKQLSTDLAQPPRHATKNNNRPS